jgi:hypothetical protein
MTRTSADPPATILDQKVDQQLREQQHYLRGLIESSNLRAD